MAFESLIARRYLQGKLRLGMLAFVISIVLFDFLAGIAALIYILAKGKRISLITIISAISVYGINVGVWALICVLSVFNGFNGIVQSLLVGFDPHVRITSATETTLNADSLIGTLQSNPQIIAAAPFISGRSAIINDEGLKVVQIRGMRNADVNSAVGLASKMVGGRFQDSTAEIPHPIVLGRALSFALRVSTGDTLSLLSQAGLEAAMTQVTSPTFIPCIVTGIFESSNKEYDTYYAYTDFSTARQLFALREGAMGIEMRLSDLEHANQVKSKLKEKLGAGYVVETWQDLHRDLISVMELERWAAFIILSLIIVVAVFNVLGSLTMTVIEKQRDVGILKTMGASDRSIRNIFMRQGAMIGLIGTTAGVIKGVAICWLQNHYGFFKLDSSVYIIPALPVQLRISDLVIVAITALVLAACAAIYPARRASKIPPADAVRWE